MKRESRCGSATQRAYLCHPCHPEPGESGEWIVFFKKSAGRSYFLVDDNDEVESFSGLDDLIEVVRGLGIKFAEIHM